MIQQRRCLESLQSSLLYWLLTVLHNSWVFQQLLSAAAAGVENYWEVRLTFVGAALLCWITLLAAKLLGALWTVSVITMTNQINIKDGINIQHSVQSSDVASGLVLRNDIFRDFVLADCSPPASQRCTGRIICFHSKTVTVETRCTSWRVLRRAYAGSSSLSLKLVSWCWKGGEEWVGEYSCSRGVNWQNSG